MRASLALAALLLVGCVPKDSVEHFRFAEGERARGHTTKARNLYREFLQRYPSDPNAPLVRFNLGMTYFEQENYTLAAREFTEVANRYPDSEVLWRALYYGGVCHARLGRCPDALEYFSVVVGGTEGRNAPAKLKADAQGKMDELNDDMQGPHQLCTVKPRG